jgi:diacylglycerol kinase
MNKFKVFWDYAWERSLKTVAQSALAVLTVESIVDLSDVNWMMILGVSVLSGIVSLLTSVINFDFSTGLPIAELTKEN